MFKKQPGKLPPNYSPSPQDQQSNDSRPPAGRSDDLSFVDPESARRYLESYQAPQPAKLSVGSAPSENGGSFHTSDAPITKAGTLLYVHGIANKPLAKVLRCQWDVALFGQSVGERSRMVYWVNRERHGEPTPGECGDSDTSDESSTSLFQSGISPRTFSEGSVAETGRDFAYELASEVCPASDRDALKQLTAIGQKLLLPGAPETTASGPAAMSQAEVIPLPLGIRQWLTRQITWLLLGDVYDYLYDQAFQYRVDQAFRRRILSGGAPFVVVGHSLGSVIAYKNLIQMHEENLIGRVPLFLTLGSPLGIQEIQDRLKERLYRRISG